MRKDVDGLKSWRENLKAKVAVVATGLSLFASAVFDWAKDRWSGGGHS